MIDSLCQTYASIPNFIFHQVCHQDATLYMNAIHAQNHYLANSQVVPISGISENLKFDLEDKILQIPGVKAMLRHKSTAITGRSNVMTTQNHFSSVVKTLDTQLLLWAKFYIDQKTIDNNDLPNAYLLFKSKFQDNESDSTFGLYLSACSSMYSVHDNPLSDPPVDSIPVTQAWGVPKKLTNPLPEPPSTVSQEEFEKVSKENKQLSLQIGDLQEQFSLLLQQQQSKQAPASPPPPPQPTIPNIDSLIENIMTKGLSSLH